MRVDGVLFPWLNELLIQDCKYLNRLECVSIYTWPSWQGHKASKTCMSWTTASEFRSQSAAQKNELRSRVAVVLLACRLHDFDCAVSLMRGSTDRSTTVIIFLQAGFGVPPQMSWPPSAAPLPPHVPTATRSSVDDLFVNVRVGDETIPLDLSSAVAELAHVMRRCPQLVSILRPRARSEGVHLMPAARGCYVVGWLVLAAVSLRLFWSTTVKHTILPRGVRTSPG